MGFIKAFAGAIGGTFADQWKDFIMPMTGVPGTAALFPAVAQGQNNGRGENTKGSANIISSSSLKHVANATKIAAVAPGVITTSTSFSICFFSNILSLNSFTPCVGGYLFLPLFAQNAQIL